MIGIRKDCEVVLTSGDGIMLFFTKVHKVR